MQAAKVLDVTRSFIPVDPNAYPETLHGTGYEDDPEKRVPVVPYMGHNFLPTAHGYKSFFGTNAALNIDTLAPNKPDYVFMYQTLTYVNVLIALCDTGIWAKSASSIGAWTQLVVKNAPATDTFYEWYFVTIKNKLYCFRANDIAFYEIDTDIAELLGISCEAIVPNFITPAAQLGMFRLGARIGFWDGSNAVAWCNPDDFSDFTPSVLTGANVTTFNSVTGKISAIRSHGNNALIYASKSIVGLTIQPGETFFVKAIPILQDAGIPYARQSVPASPDNTHFAYTSTGIYKITDGKPEIIVPEVFDYFKEYTAQPIYLRILQGRHLCFEILDQNLINGKPLFSMEVVPAASLTFPGYTSLDWPSRADFDLTGTVSLLDNGLTDEQIIQAAADIPEPQKKGTYATPLYTAFLSNNGVKDAANIVFGDTPCGFVGPNGTPFTMSPETPGNELSGFVADTTTKTEHSGPDSWVDGHWTIERFVQTQSAIWKAEEAVLQEVVDKIVNRAFNEVKTTEFAGSCVVANPAPAYCDLGDYITQFSDYKFGFNQCSFWLTRYVLEFSSIRAKHSSSVRCDPIVTGVPQTHWARYQNGNFVAQYFGTADDAAAAWDYTTAGAPYSLGAPVEGTVTASPGSLGYLSTAVYYINDKNGSQVGGGPGGGNYIVAVWDTSSVPGGMVITQTAAPGPSPALPTLSFASTTKVETGTAINEIFDTETGVFGVETAYCLLTHWKYTDANGNQKIVPASTCMATADKYPETAPTPSRQVPYEDTRDSVISADGSVLGKPFELPDLIDFGVDWPDQTITYPEFSFLLQNGGIAPKYPTIYGFFSYDLHLKKWGKAKFEYKQLLDYSPINSESSSPINFTNFGILAGAVKADGFIYIFDDAPADSELTWGKIGYYRAGMTDAQEVRFDFASLCSGNLLVDVSLDGQQIISSLRTSTAYDNAKQVVAYPPYSAKWFNITLQGKYDVSFGEFKGLKKGRR